MTPLGPTKMMIVHNGNLTPMSLDPSDYGIQPCNPEELAVHSKSEAVDVLKNILAGKGPRAMMDMVILNVGSHVPAGGAHGPVRLHGESAGSRLRRHRKENASCCLTGSGKPRRRK